jgi:hypothetical protein
MNKIGIYSVTSVEKRPTRGYRWALNIIAEVDPDEVYHRIMQIDNTVLVRYTMCPDEAITVISVSEPKEALSP